MPGTDITYTTRDDENFTGYLAAPDGDEKAPGILLVTAIFGVDDEMKELSDAWAADGFLVSTPDIFWRVMPGPTADMEKAFARFGAFDQDQGMRDIEDLSPAVFDAWNGLWEGALSVHNRFLRLGLTPAHNPQELTPLMIR